jgi:hypothetical protein
MSTNHDLPQTPLTREALTRVSAAVDPVILQHSKRSYLLAKAYARNKQIGFDDEGLCLASLFHDLGLSPSLRERGVAFPRTSSGLLAEFLAERGVVEERILPLVDAIDFHMQLLPRWSKGNVAGLMQVGAWMDATGLRRRAVKAEAALIADEIPRADFDRVFRGRLWESLTSWGACVGLLFPKTNRRQQSAPAKSW